MTTPVAPGWKAVRRTRILVARCIATNCVNEVWIFNDIPTRCQLVCPGLCRPKRVTERRERMCPTRVSNVDLKSIASIESKNTAPPLLPSCLRASGIKLSDTNQHRLSDDAGILVIERHKLRLLCQANATRIARDGRARRLRFLQAARPDEPSR